MTGKPVTCRPTKEQYAKLRALSLLTGKTLSDIMKEALEQYLQGVEIDIESVIRLEKQRRAEFDVTIERLTP